MIKIRLSRLGTRNRPFYRIVAIDEREKCGGTPRDIIGYWHPSQNKVEVDKDKIKSWVKKGAQISTAVSKLIK
jgi:small subunit ribosomal protein S16